MRKYRRIFTIVVDSLGVGALPDAADYGDAGTDTLGHISQQMDEFHIPNLKKLTVLRRTDGHAVFRNICEYFKIPDDIHLCEIHKIIHTTHSLMIHARNPS